MSGEDDNEILRLEYLYAIKAKPAKIEKVDKTIYLSAAVYKKIAVYKGGVSAMIEEDLIKRLRADGYLPPSIVHTGTTSGGGAQEYFNPSKAPQDPAPDYVLDNPFEKAKPKAPPEKPAPKKPKK